MSVMAHILNYKLLVRILHLPVGPSSSGAIVPLRFVVALRENTLDMEKEKQVK